MVFFCSVPPRNDAFIADRNWKMYDASLKALYVPLEKITLFMVPDRDPAELKKTNPIYLFAKKPVTSPPPVKSDSFFVEMANALVLNEISLHYKIISYKQDTNDTAHKSGTACQPQTRWSPLNRDTGSSERVGSFVKKIAGKYGVDLIILPYECSLKETETQKTAWRDNKYGKYYDKPSTVDANALFHVQIWDKNGRLHYERIGTSLCKRQAFYEALKQTQPRNKSLVDYSKNIFAPTAVRALGIACRNAFVGE
jgi:hypothetical protein